MSTSLRSISNHNHYHKCVRYCRIVLGTVLPECCWRWLSSQSQFSFKAALMSTTILRPVLASKAHAFLALMKALALSSTSSGRIYVGLLLIVTSPLAACIHLLFDRSETVSWLAEYHQNYFHLFNVIGAWLFALVVCFGLFLILPPVVKTWKVFKYTLQVQVTRILSIPIGFVMGKIVWLVQTTSNEDYWSLPGWSYTIVGLGVGYMIIRSMDYFIWKQFHALDALLDSLAGLHQIDLPAEVLREKAAPLIQEIKQFHSRY
jgi:hypothetical protein